MKRRNRQNENWKNKTRISKGIFKGKEESEKVEGILEFNNGQYWKTERQLEQLLK